MLILYFVQLFLADDRVPPDQIEFTLLAYSALICFVFSSPSIYFQHSDLIYSGMMRKVCKDQTLFFVLWFCICPSMTCMRLFWCLFQSSYWAVNDVFWLSVYDLYETVLVSFSVIVLSYKWCLLIHLNNKDWYFFPLERI